MCRRRLGRAVAASGSGRSRSDPNLSRGRGSRSGASVREGACFWFEKEHIEDLDLKLTFFPCDWVIFPFTRNLPGPLPCVARTCFVLLLIRRMSI